MRVRNHSMPWMPEGWVKNSNQNFYFESFHSVLARLTLPEVYPPVEKDRQGMVRMCSHISPNLAFISCTPAQGITTSSGGNGWIWSWWLHPTRNGFRADGKQHNSQSLIWAKHPHSLTLDLVKAWLKPGLAGTKFCSWYANRMVSHYPTPKTVDSQGPVELSCTTMGCTPWSPLE